MNKYHIVITEEFVNMLYITLLPMLNISSSYVNLIYSETLYNLEILKKFPDMFSIFEIPINNIYYKKIVLEKRYLIIYSIKSNFIYIHYLIDARRNPNNYLI